MDRPTPPKHNSKHDIWHASYSAVPNLAVITGDLIWNETGPSGSIRGVYSQSAILDVEVDTANGQARGLFHDQYLPSNTRATSLPQWYCPVCMMVQELTYFRKLHCGHGICTECFANRAPLPDEDVTCITCTISVDQLEKGQWQAAQLNVLLDPFKTGSSRITRIFQARNAAVPDKRIDPALPVDQGKLQPRTHTQNGPAPLKVTGCLETSKANGGPNSQEPRKNAFLIARDKQ